MPRVPEHIFPKTIIPFAASNDGHTKLNDSQDKLFLGDSVPNNIDAIILAPKDFKDIFGIEKSKAPICIKRLPVVKITFNGKTIYRRYYGSGPLSGTEKAALNYSSLYEFVDDNLDEIKGKTVQISKGCRLPYYWNHPFHATRISFRLGLISVVFASASLLLSLFCSLPIIHQ